MNIDSDGKLPKPSEKAETTLKEPQAEPSPLLVDLGRVSDTHGGVLGFKFDNGAGFVTY